MDFYEMDNNQIKLLRTILLLGRDYFLTVYLLGNMFKTAIGVTLYFVAFNSRRHQMTRSPP
jgi:hypothetical protein